MNTLLNQTTEIMKDMNTFIIKTTEIMMNIEITWKHLITYVSMLIMASFPIYIGSHLSLKQKAVESMSASDAWKFPFIGSLVLFGLYILFKIFSKEYINLLLTGYFLIFGILAISATIRPIFLPFFGKELKSLKYTLKTFWKKNDTEKIEIEFDKIDILSFIISTFIGLWYIMTKHWIANNIFGLSFSIQGISLISIGSYKIGCILLGGLFFYDIFWVFGTEVMVTVAKSFDAPIKLLFPKDISAETLEFSMLGLGDIVIPGIFIALLLRFDAKKSLPNKNFSKIYFYTCYIGYIFGLMSTIIVMHIFQAAQPALLYLVPSCIGTSLFLSIIRGEFKELLKYHDENNEEKKEK
jgi:minor histocompatibility antigen H13